MKLFSITALVIVLAVGAAAAEQPGPYDWKLDYSFRVANPSRQTVEVTADYEFPAKTGEVTFSMDDADNHYTKGYRQHVRAFVLYDSEGNQVEVTKDTAGVYRSLNLKGKYQARYFVVMDHFKQQSELGIDDTPLLWGSAAIFPGAALVIYPSDEAGSRIGSITVSFEGTEQLSFVTPYTQIAPDSYKVPDVHMLKSEFWAVGYFDTFVYELGGDSIVCAVSKDGLGFTLDDIEPKIRAILDYYAGIFGKLPAHKITMSVYYTPSSGKASGLHSFGTVGKRSFNCLIDEKVTSENLGSQMGLVAYNFLSFWTPGYFRPQSTAELDWFTTGVMNYMQLKTMLRLGFIEDLEFLGKIGRTYTMYREQLQRKKLSLSVLLTMPNSNDRSVYSFMMVSMYDLLLVKNTNGERSLDDVLMSLSHSYGDTRGYSGEELYSLLKDLGIANIEELNGMHFDKADPIELNELVQPFGYDVSYLPSGEIDIGMRLGGEGDLTVEWIAPGGPAQNAGIEFGDVLTEVRGFKLSEASDLPKLLSRMQPGTSVNVAYVRDGERKKTKVKLGNRMVYQIGLVNSSPGSSNELWEIYKSM